MGRVIPIERREDDPYYPDLRPLTHAQRDYLAAFDAYLLAPRCSTEEDEALEAMTARLAPVLCHDRGVRFAGMSLGRTDVEVEVMQELLTNRERETLRRFQGGMSAARIAQLYKHDFPGGQAEVAAKIGDMRQRVERGVTRVREGLPAGPTELDKAQERTRNGLLPPMGATRAGVASVTPLRPREEPKPVEPTRRPDMAAAKHRGNENAAAKAAERDRSILAWMRDNAPRCAAGRWGDALEIPQGSHRSVVERLVSHEHVRCVKDTRPREYEITERGLEFAGAHDCSGAVSRALPPAADELPIAPAHEDAPEQTTPAPLPERVLVQEPIEAGEGRVDVELGSALFAHLLVAGADWSAEKTHRYVGVMRELRETLALT